MKWETQNQFIISSQQATNKIPKRDQPLKQNPTQYRSAAPLDLNKDIRNIYTGQVYCS